jgi:uncharacterized membrane protein
MTREFFTWAAAVFYVTAGSLHLLQTAAYLKIMPPFVPHPLAIVYFSGLAEIAGGIGLLIRPLQRAAAFGLITLLVAVLPANVYMAVENIQVTATPIPNWLLYARLPVQLLLIWWLWRIRRPASGAA